MPDVSSTAPEQVRLWVALDVHKFSIVAATLPPEGGSPEVQQIETTAAAIRRFIARLGGPEGLAVCYEAGPGGYDLLRLLGRIGAACDVVAPSLVPVRPGDRVKTDRRDAKKLVRLFRAGELRFVAPPSPEHEGLRDLCAAAMTCVARGPRRVTRSPSSCCATATSIARARNPGPSSTSRGSAPSAWSTRSPSARWSTPASIWTASTPSSQRWTPSLSRSPAASRGPTRCAGCARSAGSPTAPRWACWPRSATGTAS